MLFVYAQLWLPGLILTKRDAFQFFLPLKQYIIERLSSGQFPQWFPYEGLGRPFLGIPITGVFHPFTLLYFVLPVHEAYRFSTLLSCLMGAMGMFVLGRALGFSRVGTMGASVTFVCSGYMFSLTENLAYFYSFCLLPIFCFTLERAIRDGMRWVAINALVWASVFLNGDIQTGYYFGFLALTWGLARGKVSWLRSLGYVSCSACLAAMVAAIQLGPAWGVLLQSDRLGADSFHLQAVHWSTHPLRLLSLVVGPIGNDDDHDRIASALFGGFKPGQPAAGYWAESLYLGILPIGLTWLGIRSRRDLRFLALFGGVVVVLALGKYGGLYEMAYRFVPLWSAFRYPERLMALVTFVVAVFAGAGIDCVRCGRLSVSPWVIVGLLCVCASGVAFFAQGVEWLTPSPSTPGLAMRLAESLTVAWLYSAGVACVVAFLFFLMTRQHVPWVMAASLLVALTAADLCRVNMQVLNTGPAELWTFTPSLAKAIREHSQVEGPGHFRVYTFSERQIVVPSDVVSALDVRGRDALAARQALHLEANAPFGLESARAYLPGFSQAFLMIGEIRSLEMAARYNVAYFIGRRHRFKDKVDDDVIVNVLPQYDLMVIKSPVVVKPRAYLSLHPKSVPAQVNWTELLNGPDFVNGAVDYVEEGEAGLLPAADGARARVAHYSEESIAIEVSTPQPTVLLLLDSYAPGWRAVLQDGIEIPIRRGNGFIRAVTIPSGDHTVQFTYRTPFLTLGLTLSVIGFLTCLYFMRPSPRHLEK